MTKCEATGQVHDPLPPSPPGQPEGLVSNSTAAEGQWMGDGLIYEAVSKRADPAAWDAALRESAAALSGQPEGCELPAAQGNAAQAEAGMREWMAARGFGNATPWAAMTKLQAVIDRKDAELRDLAARQAPDGAVDAARLDLIYRLAMVEPFVAPIATKEKWLASIDARLAKEPAQ